MYHTNLQSTVCRLLFVYVMILNAPLISDREYIRRFKQELIDKTTKTKIRVMKSTVIEYKRKY